MDGTGMRRLAAGTLSLLAFLAVWKLLTVVTGTPDYILPAPEVVAETADRGWALLQTHGCHTCHTIPGVPEANALVGPPLTAWRDRQYIAGSLPNNAENLVLWLMEPQTIEPGTAMPDMAVTDQDARDMGAYLFTLERDDD